MIHTKTLRDTGLINIMPFLCKQIKAEKIVEPLLAIVAYVFL
tara:strand:- start:622 stop:747 length:126 start_codon:yes stop_codon:yes gene_type:complete